MITKHFWRFFYTAYRAAGVSRIRFGKESPNKTFLLSNYKVWSRTSISLGITISALPLSYLYNTFRYTPSFLCHQVHWTHTMTDSF